MSITELLATIDAVTNPELLDALADAIDERRKAITKASRPTWHVGLGVTWEANGVQHVGRIHDVRPGAPVGVRAKDGVPHRVSESDLVAIESRIP